MENLAKGFVYLAVLAWAGIETLLYASSNGAAWPVLAAFAVFAVGFVVVGCYPLKDSAVETTGRIFFSLCLVAGLAFSVRTVMHDPLAGTLKLLAGAFLGLFILRPPAKQHQSAGH